MINELLNVKDKNVLVIGDIMLDHYINVEPKKISDEAPLIVFSYKNEYYSLGGCTNVAKYISNFGCKVDLLGVIGTDGNSKIVLNELKKYNINDKFVIQDDNIVTTTKIRLFSSDNKQVLRYDKEETLFDFKSIVIDKIKQMKNDYDLIVISDYNKGVITSKLFDEVVKFANNIPVICDPKNKNLQYKDLFLLKPNKKEMESIISDFTDEKIIDYKNRNNIKNIVLTLGKNGMKVYNQNNDVYTIKAHESIVYDVTGAGDSVLSFLALGILAKLDFIDTCKLANYAASIKVHKFGTEIVGLDEVVDFFTNKIIGRDELKSFCDLIHKNNKIVFTNGCFDIIHSGHIHTLRSAKSEGDILILGLNSDASIKRLKGDSRPILSEEERIDILASLEFVDYIVVFDEDTPLNIIKDIRPDVLVKGSDYSNKFIVGKKEVEEYGGKVVLVNLVKGKSTTNIINRIKGD